jgi:hypothetical protein
MVGGLHSCTGIYAPAPSRVELNVQAGNFSGAAGVHDQNMNPSAGVHFVILQEGIPLWERTVRAYEAAVRFSVPVTEGTVLLVATGRNPSYDGASWVDLTVP